jgi:hypothetical protein
MDLKVSLKIMGVAKVAAALRTPNSQTAGRFSHLRRFEDRDSIRFCLPTAPRFDRWDISALRHLVSAQFRSSPFGEAHMTPNALCFFAG